MEKLKGKLSGLKTALIMFAFGLIAFFCLLMVVKKASGSYDKTDILVAIKDVAPNTEITEENVDEYFTTASADIKFAGKNTIKDKKEIIGKYNTELIRESENINSSIFSDAEDVKSQFTSPVEGSFAVSSFSDAVSGRIRKGDYVDVYVVDAATKVTTKATHLPVYISNVYDGNGVLIETSDSATTALSFNFLMEKHDEEEFYSAIAGNSVIVTKVEK